MDRYTGLELSKYKQNLLEINKENKTLIYLNNNDLCDNRQPYRMQFYIDKIKLKKLV
jgi:hypothetical protein